VLDDIRLAVVDAFFSLPRGGAEIGGILLGSHDDGRVIVAGYQALDCEHAFGPGFTLSAHDKALLAGILATGRPANLRPVGWYHSHTRSEIFLSDADLEIHNGYFPEPWQVALVIKPHTFQPARAGFFFRERDAAIHRAASYLEFHLEPLDVRPLPPTAPLPDKHDLRPEPGSAPPRAGSSPPSKPVTSAKAAPVTPIAPAAEPVVEPAVPAPVAVPSAASPPQADDRPETGPALQLEIPGFLQPAPQRSRLWLKVAASVAAAMALGGAASATRQAWLPQVLAGFERLHKGSAAPPVQSVPQAPPAAIGLNVLDNNGQLQIRWDRNSATVENGANALLEILDAGQAPRAIPLDEAHLRGGSFTYARTGERVDVVLVIDQPNREAARESTAFLGKAPERPEDIAAMRKQLDDALAEKAKLESDVEAANDRNKKLEKSLSATRELMRIRQRLGNQVPK